MAIVSSVVVVLLLISGWTEDSESGPSAVTDGGVTAIGNCLTRSADHQQGVFPVHTCILQINDLAFMFEWSFPCVLIRTGWRIVCFC